MTESQLFCAAYASSACLAELSGRRIPPHRGYGGIACWIFQHIGRILHTNFPAQSLHLRFGSAVPCPTLRPAFSVQPQGLDTGSWFRLTRGPCYYILPACKVGRLSAPPSSGNQFVLIPQLAPQLSYSSIWFRNRHSLSQRMRIFPSVNSGSYLLAVLLPVFEFLPDGHSINPRYSLICPSFPISFVPMIPVQ